MTDYAGEVSAGLALLDRAKPGWEAEVDLDMLNMVQPDLCVLGQVFGNYWTGMRILFRTNSWAQVTTDAAVAAGFNLPSEHQDPETFPALKDAWVSAIRQRNKEMADA